MAAAAFSVTITLWNIGNLGGAILNKNKNMEKKKIYYLSRADSWGKTIQEGLGPEGTWRRDHRIVGEPSGHNQLYSSHQ